MANRDFETRPGEPNYETDKNSSSKKDDLRFGMPPRRVERSAGRAALPPDAHHRMESSKVEIPDDRERQYRAARAVHDQQDYVAASHRAEEEAESKKEKSNAGSPAPNSGLPRRKGDRTEPLSREEWRELMSYARPFPDTRGKEGVETPKSEAAATAAPDSKSTPDKSDFDQGEVQGPRDEQAELEDRITNNEEFRDFMERHPILHDLEVPVVEDLSYHTRGQSGAASEGDHTPEVAEDEDGSRELPQGTAGVPPRPPVPPPGEGGSWEDEPDDYVPARGFGGYAANPQLLHDPWANAGNLLSPDATNAITALEAQQRLDSLRHTSRERGLAGAVGILGLGLVVEHILAKRRDKKQQRQINKHHKEAQGTQRAFRQEQYLNRQARQELQRIKSEQQSRHETTSRIAEAATATAAVEMARKKIRQAEAVEVAPISTTVQRELAKQIEADPVLARAVQKSRERQERLETVQQTKIRERELRHERIRNDHTSTIIQARSRASSAALQQKIALQPGSLRSGQGETGISTQLSGAPSQNFIMAHRWTWAVAGFIAVAAILAALAM